MSKNRLSPYAIFAIFCAFNGVPFMPFSPFFAGFYRRERMDTRCRILRAQLLRRNSFQFVLV
jgi:hypothetical protein